MTQMKEDFYKIKSKIEKQVKPVMVADKEIKRIFTNKREKGKRRL